MDRFRERQVKVDPDNGANSIVLRAFDPMMPLRKGQLQVYSCLY